MDVLLNCCAGLDVHQKEIVACVLTGENKVRKQIRTFGTTTKELLALSDWLQESQCTHVAMESTGVYWKPVRNILEGSFTLILANAKRIKNVPGKKTDMSDAQWIAKLLRNGLIESSFVPPEAIRNLCDLTRYRRKLLQMATEQKNRIHNVLQDANIKLTSYMSDVFGVSGRALLEAIMNGESLTYEQVHARVKTKLRAKVPQLLDALNGKIRRHHRQMIRRQYDLLVDLENYIEELEQEIDQLMTDKQEEASLLKTIPGINQGATAVILAEIGTDMTQFPSDAHLSSWGGLSPGNNESAGKKRSSKTTKGNKGLKSILCQVAWGAVRSKNTRLSAYYYRLVKRRGPKKAIMALAHLILKIIYHVLKEKRPYKELGPDYLLKRKQSAKYHQRQLEKLLGYEIEIREKTA
ncbi:IS110 family transposase [Sporolactobacillus shoreicorticis]|uniref:IS110 family transposase n=1 Tax=Sporolactobacillus shoreicorticis TaxID=1923877 RepID=A0ABW5S863_9BACL|nr:IS110 family transposase [Sporolactobacillus shoreicorticis]MCO7126068.1 IS110 family transposase [Sporolactobacillus shoreicorticis]